MNLSEQIDETNLSVQSQPSILLVDDDADCLQLLEEVIKAAFPKVRLLFASTGFEALSLAKQHRFDLVLTDIVHIGPSGFELLQFLRSSQPTLPVIVVAGFLPDSKEFERAQSLGAAACFSKTNSDLCKSLPSIIAVVLARYQTGLG